MDTPFAPLSRNPLEVLNYVRHIHFVSLNACLGKGFIQQTPSRPHERMPDTIFAIARLLSNQHHPGTGCAFTKNRLRPAFPQIASLAAFRRGAQLLGRWIQRD